MYNILTLNKIAKRGLDHLPKEKYNYGDSIENPDAILLRSFSMHDMELPENLLAVARAGAGVNNIPIEKCSEKGIVVFNTPGANANAVKELVIAALLLSSRKIVDGIVWTQNLSGDDVAKQVEKGKSSFAGPEILNKTLGVIGLGAIGVMVANAAVSLGMEVIGYDPYISVDAAWGLSRAVKRAASEKEIYENSDYITLHVPLNSETKGRINSEVVSSMKDGVKLLNFSRGELVDDDVIISAAESGKVACYVTDFPNEKLLNKKGIITIPHLGASTPESEENCAVMAVQELREYLENGNIINSVNFPNCSLEREAPIRLCITHRNVPNMLKQFSEMFSAHDINIENMLNKSRGNYAYTILDAATVPDNETLENIKSLDTVLKVRVIS
ncbi:MAG: phosphoglycerate dehydrogenase [Eubacteriales bacterium]|nr:phosphoglycerate dehydrogenase [Eubacteriales bacterium]